MSALKRLANAKSIAFNVESQIVSVSLPADTERHAFMSGKVTIAKDGTWKWIRNDGWEIHNKGATSWLKATGSTWIEETFAIDESGNPLNMARMKENLTGIAIFLIGKYKDWTVLESSKINPRFWVVASPRPGSSLKKCLDFEPAAGYYLYLDKKTGLPTYGTWRTSGSADWIEHSASYSNFVIDPAVDK